MHIGCEVHNWSINVSHMCVCVCLHRTCVRMCVCSLLAIAIVAIDSLPQVELSDFISNSLPHVTISCVCVCTVRTQIHIVVVCVVGVLRDVAQAV